MFMNLRLEVHGLAVTEWLSIRGGGAVSSPFFFWSTITSLAIFQSAHVCILWFSSSFFRKE